MTVYLVMERRQTAELPSLWEMIPFVAFTMHLHRTKGAQAEVLPPSLAIEPEWPRTGCGVVVHPPQVVR